MVHTGIKGLRPNIPKRPNINVRSPSHPQIDLTNDDNPASMNASSDTTNNAQTLNTNISNNNTSIENTMDYNFMSQQSQSSNIHRV